MLPSFGCPLKGWAAGFSGRYGASSCVLFGADDQETREAARLRCAGGLIRGWLITGDVCRPCAPAKALTCVWEVKRAGRGAWRDSHVIRPLGLAARMETYGAPIRVCVAGRRAGKADQSQDILVASSPMGRTRSEVVAVV